jgi:hypothetical protein
LIKERRISWYIIYLFFCFIYDKIFNLNSYTHIFWEFRESNPHPHRGVEFFWRGEYNCGKVFTTFSFLFHFLHFLLFAYLIPSMPLWSNLLQFYPNFYLHGSLLCRNLKSCQFLNKYKLAHLSS